MEFPHSSDSVQNFATVCKYKLADAFCSPLQIQSVAVWVRSHCWCNSPTLHTLLHDASDLAANWVQVRAVRWAQISSYEAAVSRYSSCMVWWVRLADALSCWKMNRLDRVKHLLRKQDITVMLPIHFNVEIHEVQWQPFSTQRLTLATCWKLNGCATDDLYWCSIWSQTEHKPGRFELCRLGSGGSRGVCLVMLWPI